MHFHVKEREVWGGRGGGCVASFCATASGCVFSVLGPFSTLDNANNAEDGDGVCVTGGQEPSERCQGQHRAGLPVGHKGGASL